MSSILSLPKLTHVTPIDLVLPVISKNGPMYVSTTKKEYVNESDVMFMIRSNDDRISESIKQYPNGINPGVNLNFTNSTRFIGSNSDARPQTSLPAHSVPGGSQHRIEFIPEKYIALSRPPFRWRQNITGPANPVKGMDVLPKQPQEYVTKKTVTVIPQAANMSKYPCCGTQRDYEDVQDYYDLALNAGFLMQDTLTSTVTSKVKGFQLNADVDFDGIENKMKQLLELDHQQSKTGMFTNYSDDQKGYTETKINTKYIPLENIISKPFTIVIIDPESQNVINTRKVTEKELRNLQVSAAANNSLNNRDIERVIGINLKDKETFSIQSNGSDNILYIAPTRLIPELQKLVPDHDIASKASNQLVEIDNQNRDIHILGDNKKRVTINDVTSHSSGGVVDYQPQSERGHTIINKNYQNRNMSSLQGQSEGFIPSNYRPGAIPQLHSRKIRA